MKEKKLTPKQELFVKEYLVDLNATRAAIRAGYKESSAGDIGGQLLAKTHIKAAIDAAKGKRADKVEVSAERVIKEIMRMAFYDPADIMLPVAKDTVEFVDDVQISDGRIYGLRGPGDIRMLKEDVRRAIVGWSWDKNGNFVVKLADKAKALDQLARHLALYNDKVEVSGLDGLAERLARAAGRLKDEGNA